MGRQTIFPQVTNLFDYLYLLAGTILSTVGSTTDTDKASPETQSLRGKSETDNYINK